MVVGKAPIFLLAKIGSPSSVNVSNLSLVFAGYAVVLFLVLVGMYFLLRRLLRSARSTSEPISSAHRTENASAFMAASMQGVIQKLREQEKELERLHRAEKERAQDTARLSEEVTRNMPAGLLVVNAAGIISSANPAAEQTLRVRGLNLHRYSQALGEGSSLTGLIADCLAKGTISRREEVEYVSPSKETRRLGVTISPIRRSSGERIEGAICLLTDLTEMVALQQQMQLKENLAALGELSAGIAHEFKNALATISGYAQMIMAEQLTGETADYAARILEQTQNITHVVTEFLKYARPLELCNEPVEMKEVLERVIGEVHEAMPNIPLRCEGAFEQVTGDEALLRQAFLNLARNAAEACGEQPGGGQVVIRGQAANQENGQSTQVVSVLDSGAGIPVDSLGKLFRPFHTTKPNGTGLGLAVVQKIILQHGGQVEARNRPEGGAAFIVTLPGVRRS